MCYWSDLGPDSTFVTAQLVKDGAEFRAHVTVYLKTLQSIRMGYARFCVRMNHIKSMKSNIPCLRIQPTLFKICAA
jgi:hypothetical protein